MRRPSSDAAPQRCRAAARHALVDAVRREHAGVARPAPFRAASGDEVARLGDDVHVGDVGADVARRDVAPAESLHEAPVGAQQRRRFVRRRIADDDGLAAAVGEASEGVLVGHRPAQLQHVGERGGRRRIGVEAGAAERRPERGGPDGDDRPQPGDRVVTERHLLVRRLGDHDGDGQTQIIGAGATGRRRRRESAAARPSPRCPSNTASPIACVPSLRVRTRRPRK